MATGVQQKAQKRAKTTFPKRYNDARIRRSIQLPDALDAWLCQQVAQAQHTDPRTTYSDIVRAILLQHAQGAV